MGKKSRKKKEKKRRQDPFCPECAKLIIGDCGQHDISEPGWQDHSKPLPGETFKTVGKAKVRHLKFPPGSGYNVVPASTHGYAVIILKSSEEEYALALEVDVNSLAAMVKHAETVLMRYRFKSAAKPDPQDKPS